MIISTIEYSVSLISFERQTNETSIITSFSAPISFL